MKFLTGVLLVLLTGLGCDQIPRSAEGLLHSDPPAPFDDSILPANQRHGKFIEGLGHVRQLDTYMPQTSATLSTKMSIFTRSNQAEGVSIRMKGNSYEGFRDNFKQIAGSGFNPMARTFVLIAGYMSGHDVSWMVEPKDLWLALEDCNVILVTWGGLAEMVYSSAVAETPLVARQVTVFLHYLARLFSSDIRDPQFAARIHFVGHSLGAHIAGFVGQDLGGRMGRITGLDPAGPSFDQFDESRRLDRSDALLVDVIHTNGGRIKYANAFASAPLAGVNFLLKRTPLLNRISAYLASEYTGEGDTAWFGIDAPLGHLDYYANNGKVQPGCDGLLHVNDHGRAHEIFTEVLRHELDARASGRRDRSRLEAFGADDYDDFQSGASFRRNCPNLIEPGKPTADTPAGCSIPIDMMTPVGELREELSSKYGLRLEDRRAGGHYFFKTLNCKPLVGRHYMLRLQLSLGLEWSASECRLEAQLQLATGLNVTIDLAELQGPVLTIPFVQPDETGADALVELGGNGTAAAEDLVALRARLLPRAVRLSLSGAKSASVTGTLMGKLSRLVKFGRKPKCRLTVAMVEVVPLFETNRSFAGLYAASGREFRPERIKALGAQDRASPVGASLELSMSSTREATRVLAAIVMDEPARRRDTPGSSAP